MTDRNTNHFRGRHYTADHISGPIAFLNPTTRLLPIQKAKSQPARGPVPAGPHDEGATSASASNETAPATPEGGSSSPRLAEKQQQQQQHHPGIYHIWRSRDNRKGRHALALTPSTAADTADATNVSTAGHQPTNTLKATLAGVARMFLRYPVWDVSYDVAAIFTIGSVVWVLNGFFVLLPLTNPGSSWAGESLWGGGVTAMVGATIFVVGSVFLMLEAVNENRSECFGWALEEALGRSEEDLVLRRDKSGCRHHHQEKRSFLTGKSVVDDDNDDAKGLVEKDAKGGGGDSEEGGASRSKGRRWTWWPSWYELRTHYFRDIGFLACLSQMIGATIFWIAGFTGLPQILGVLTVPATNGVYWLPQVVGGTGFIVSSLLFMLETQPNWYTPSLTTLGWHIGFWNLIGAIGFTLCGALGFASSNEVCETGLTWSTFIGSWAFLGCKSNATRGGAAFQHGWSGHQKDLRTWLDERLDSYSGYRRRTEIWADEPCPEQIGSVIQWYESLDKYPVAVGEVSGLKEKSQGLAIKAKE
ncbi:hypothetical protein VMCG_07932 [Cytospora schulzeri]|uniref:Integral membrane protein n=1 Tax=Cytospora schulzeri TaxID=448051 RepID=A0A423W0G3_9PEZI|nr:hypothetical protein VMCG_07932 [Valsa malicola]